MGDCYEAMAEYRLVKAIALLNAPNSTANSRIAEWSTQFSSNVKYFDSWLVSIKGLLAMVCKDAGSQAELNTACPKTRRNSSTQTPAAHIARWFEDSSAYASALVIVGRYGFKGSGPMYCKEAR